MTKAELVKDVADVAGLTHAQAEAALKGLASSLVSNVLEAGESVSVPGLGTFKQVKTAGRVGRNPKTGGSIAIAPSTKLAFKMSSTLK
jgi:DNA-binding protein HU-beta